MMTIGKKKKKQIIIV